MNKFIYSFKDLLLSAYSVPRFEDKDPVQYMTGLKRAILKGFTDEQLVQFVGQDLYCLGTYNDDNATFDLYEEPQCILKCNAVIKQRCPDYFKKRKAAKKAEVKKLQERAEKEEEFLNA